MSASPPAILSAVAAGLVALAAASLLLHGWSEDGVRAFVRASARVSLILLLLVFPASSLLRLRPAAVTRWLVRNRRGLGLSFALSQASHLVALVLLGLFFPDPFLAGLSAVTLVGGGLAYALTAAMAATSSDRAIRALGARRWRALHSVGLYTLWLLFLNAYVGRASESAAAAVVVAALVAAFLLRARFWLRRRPAAAAG